MRDFLQKSVRPVLEERIEGFFTGSHRYRHITEPRLKDKLLDARPAAARAVMKDFTAAFMKGKSNKNLVEIVAERIPKIIEEVQDILKQEIYKLIK
jgi:hypothetical protein